PRLDDPVDEGIQGNTIVMRVGRVVGVETGPMPWPGRSNRVSQEVDRQTLVVRARTVAAIERARCDPGGDQTEQQSGENVGHVELSRVAAVGENNPGPEHPDGEPAHAA